MTQPEGAGQPPVQSSESTSWIERTGFTRLFEALHLAVNFTALRAAFVGVALTCLAGFALDWVWPSSSRPVVYANGLNELQKYRLERGPAVDVSGLLQDSEKTGSIGVFALLLNHARLAANAATEALVTPSFDGLYAVLAFAFSAIVWLFAVHPVYGVLFATMGFIIWGHSGGAVARAVAMQFARRDPISFRDASEFSRARLMNFVLAPLVFPAVILLIGLVLWLIGLVGAIPAVEILVGIAFPIVIVLGILAGFCAILFLLTAPILTPSIAVDDLDPWEAFSQTIGFVLGKPWKYAVCLFGAGIYGAVCILILKVFLALSLWLAGTFLGSSMNWGDAYALDAAGKNVSAQDKLSAMWQPPQPGDGRPFIGTFEGETLRFPSSYGRSFIRAWIWVLWGVVAAFAVSFFYASGTIVYFIMRRDLNDTDMEDVYLEGSADGASSAKAVGGS